jgi:hypothetical protein
MEEGLGCMEELNKTMPAIGGREEVVGSVMIEGVEDETIGLSELRAVK